MKKLFKYIRIISLSLLTIVLLLIVGLYVYTYNSYGPIDAMYEAIKTVEETNVVRKNAFDHISFSVENPKNHLIIIPGGKVKPESYMYLALKLANEGYDVTIVKTLFNLAILTPNYGAKFIRDDMDNVVIGHSLGGTVASMFSSKDEAVTKLIFLASYPLKDVRDKKALLILGQNDLILNKKALQESIEKLPDDYQTIEIAGGNHSGFGFYGQQKGDGPMRITILEQQNLVVYHIIEFIETS